MSVTLLPLLAFPALMLTAAGSDVARYTIPNWLCLALALVFPVAAAATGQSALSVGLHLGVGVIAFAVCAGLFALNWMGGGDAKLIAAGALWLGPAAILDFVLVTALAGGLLALVLIGLRTAAMRSLVPAGQAWLARLAEPRGPTPYGVAICAGALAAMPASRMFALLFANG